MISLIGNLSCSSYRSGTTETKQSVAQKSAGIKVPYAHKKDVAPADPTVSRCNQCPAYVSFQIVPVNKVSNSIRISNSEAYTLYSIDLFVRSNASVYLSN